MMEAKGNPENLGGDQSDHGDQEEKSKEKAREVEGFCECVGNLTDSCAVGFGNPENNKVVKATVFTVSSFIVSLGCLLSIPHHQDAGAKALMGVGFISLISFFGGIVYTFVAVVQRDNAREERDKPKTEEPGDDPDHEAGEGGAALEVEQTEQTAWVGGFVNRVYDNVAGLWGRRPNCLKSEREKITSVRKEAEEAVALLTDGHPTVMGGQHSR